MVDKMRKGIMKGREFSYARCPICHAQGPSDFTLEEEDSMVYRKTIERWNERDQKYKDF